MLQIQVSGGAGEGKSAIMHMIRDLLREKGKAVLMVEEFRVVENPSARPVDVVIIEQQESRARSGGKFDFLIGKTEAAAYELAQDNDFMVRIIKRNNIDLGGTCDYQENRANLSIIDNIVVSWSIG